MVASKGSYATFRFASRFAIAAAIATANPQVVLALIDGPLTGVSTGLLWVDPFDDIYQTTGAVTVIEFAP